ncbi:MAG: DNA mismatch repair endonuclease MutL [Nitrospirota bacterium]
MTQTITILSEQVINKIAAGEVIERPAAVVKELIENSLDAGADNILIEIEQAGRQLIRIADNGSGMSREDACIACERHATSKITSDADLAAIRTLGFRGEALSSIASVSSIRLSTSQQGSQSGVVVEMEGGQKKTVSDTAVVPGTTIEVRRLFFNTPARLKFLRNPATEFAHILTVVSRLAMAHPSVRFKLMHNKKAVLDLPASMRILDRAFQIYGRDLTEHLFEFSCKRDDISLFGLLSRPSFDRGNKTYQDFYVNQRVVKNPSLTHALYQAYQDLLMRNRHPIGFIFIQIDPAWIDVNVHPAKSEIRFRNQAHIHDLIVDTLREQLRIQGLPGSNNVEKKEPPEYSDRVREACREFESRAKKSSLSATIDIPGFHHTYNDNIEGQQPLLVHPRFSNFVPVAQIQDSFIVVDSQDEMALIDQHAAHERVLFEKLQDQFEAGTMPIQNLLVPEQLELGPAQASLLSEHLSELEQLGLYVEHFGTSTFLIKAVPALLTGADYRKLVLDILDEFHTHARTAIFSKHRDDLLSVLACHPAIKMHRKLSVREMESLIDDLFACRMPHSCPHGRPTIVRFSLQDLKKMFKKIS